MLFHKPAQPPKRCLGRPAALSIGSISSKSRRIAWAVPLMNECTSSALSPPRCSTSFISRCWTPSCPVWILLAIALSFVLHDLMYGPQAALIAECFPTRLRYSGSSIGYQLASVIADGQAPLIATALLPAFGLDYMIPPYILFCAIVSIVATALLTDYTNRDIS
jgi:hypothetical protein